MTFWEKHRRAIIAALWCVFLFAIAWLGYLRGAAGRARDYAAKIADLDSKDKLGRFYPQLVEGTKKGVQHPLLTNERDKCIGARREYDRQLKEMMDRVRFPFGTEIKWTEIHSNPKGIPPEFLTADMTPGVYVTQQYQRVRKNVFMHLTTVREGLVTRLDPEKWLNFETSPAAYSVGSEKAQKDARICAICEKVGKLAIDSGVSELIRVTPESVVAEPAYYATTATDGKPVRKPYANKFIVNYPVRIEMIGSVESIMCFFHRLRGEKHFLVIRAFSITGLEEGEKSGSARRVLRDGEEVRVAISAACMDFDDRAAPAGQPAVGQVPAEDDTYSVRRKPLGY